MIIEKYKNYDLFLITKDNWKQQPDLFYGYKTVDDEGFWLRVKNYPDEDKLIIKGSYIQPPLAIYNDGNFWAISNNFKVLEEYLVNLGIKLTEDPTCFDTSTWEGLNIGYCTKGYPETATPWNEIKLTPNFSWIFIKNDKLTIKPIEHKLFTTKLEDGYAIVDTWFKKYATYLFTLNLEHKRLLGEISGGIDSRFLLNFWKNLDMYKIVCNWRKRGDPDYFLIDGVLGRLAISYFSELKERLNKPVKPIVGEISKEIPKEEQNLFWYGISLAQSLSQKCQYIEGKPEAIRFFKISGVGTEWLKEPTANDLSFVLGTIRRYFIPKFIHQYYYQKVKTVLPYLDSSFMQLQGYTDRTFLVTLYLKYNKDMLEFPFFTGGLFYMTPESELVKARYNIERWENSENV